MACLPFLSAIENLTARTFAHCEPLVDLPVSDSQIDEDSPEYCDDAVEHFGARSPFPRPAVSALNAPSGVSAGASKGHSEETFLRLFESFDVYPEEKGSERRIRQPPAIERVEDGTDRRRPADVVVESHLEISELELTG